MVASTQSKLFNFLHIIKLLFSKFSFVTISIGVLYFILSLKCHITGNGGNIRSQDEREQIHPLNPSGIYDEIGVERRLREQDGHIMYDTNNSVPSMPSSQDTDDQRRYNGELTDAGTDGSLGIAMMGGELSYSILSQGEPVY